MKQHHSIAVRATVLKATLKASLMGLVAAGGLVAASAHAEGLYVGGSLGVPDYRNSINNIGTDSSGLSAKVYGGYQLTPYVGLEAGAARLGNSRNDFGSLKSHAVYLDAVGTLPVGQSISLIGSLGVAHVNVNTTQGDDDATGLKLGAGLQYSITNNTAVRAEWERYRPDVFGARTNIDQYTVGVNYAF